MTSVFDAQRRVTQGTDALGKQTRFAFDVDGSVIRAAAEIGAQWLVSCSTYTATGKLLEAWGPTVMVAASTP